MHTSTITVAVLTRNHGYIDAFKRRGPEDFCIEWFNGTVGAGGQFRNKTATAIRLKHLPTGLVQTAQTRSRLNSQQTAMEAMNKTLDEAMTLALRGAANAERKSQIGAGMRGAERRRTFRFQEDQVIDHLTGRSARARAVMKGAFDLLWG